MQGLTERTAARVERVLRSHGRYLDDDHLDDGADQADSLDEHEAAELLEDIRGRDRNQTGLRVCRVG